MKERISVALTGNLEEFMEEELDLAERAITAGVRSAGARAKRLLRQDVLAGGLGPRLARSWRQKDYPRGQASLAAASIIYTKAPELLRVFDEGATIRSAAGFYLAIPTPDAPKLGEGRKRLTPSNFPERRFGPLRFVYREHGASLLVVDNQRQRQGKRGGYALSKSKRALKTGHGLMTVPMFFLVPRVRLKRRLNIDKNLHLAMRSLAEDIDTAFRTLRRRKRRRK